MQRAWIVRVVLAPWLALACSNGSTTPKDAGGDAPNVGDAQGDAPSTDAGTADADADAWSGDPSLFASACGPLPALSSYPEAGPDVPDAACPATPVAWSISAHDMLIGAGDNSGPGLCYGIAEFYSDGTQRNTCTAFHCETLRYCSGAEHAQYCSVRAICDAGTVTPFGYTW